MMENEVWEKLAQGKDFSLILLRVFSSDSIIPTFEIYQCGWRWEYDFAVEIVGKRVSE